MTPLTPAERQRRARAKRDADLASVTHEAAFLHSELARVTHENEALRREIAERDSRNDQPSERESRDVLSDAPPRAGASASLDLINVNNKTPKSKSTAMVREIFDYWREQTDHPRAVLDSKRSTAIAARLRDGFTAEDLRLAIDGAAKHAFVNPQGRRFDDIELICRNASKVEDFMGRARTQPLWLVPDAPPGRRENASDLLRALGKA